MKQIKLSICIPTFNRKHFLENLLNSIINSLQAVRIEDVEICISDNGSSDGTNIMLSKWISKNKISVKCHFEVVNKGADWNFINVASMGSGEYLWIIGSDDYLPKDSLKIILNSIKSSADIYLFGRNNVESNDDSKINPQYFTINPGIYNLEKIDQITHYLDGCIGIGGLFSYLSSNIIKREKWNCNLVGIHKFQSSSYSHAFVICKIAFSGGNVEVIKKIIINNRIGNDSFQNKGGVNRVLIDLSGYKLILDNIEELLLSKNSKKFIEVIFRERPIIRTILYLRKHSTNEEWIRVKQIYLELGVSRVTTILFDFFPFIASIAYSKFVKKIMRII